MESAKSVALIKKNSEVPSYAVTFVADKFYITLKNLANCKIAFSLYIMALTLFVTYCPFLIIPCSSSTKPILISTNNLRIFIIAFALTAF